MVINARLELSLREYQVALLYRDCNLPAEIAAILSLTRDDVKTYLKRIKAKLGNNWKTNKDVYFDNFGLGLDASAAAALYCDELTLKNEALKDKSRILLLQGVRPILSPTKEQLFHDRALTIKELSVPSRRRIILKATGLERYMLGPLLREMLDQGKLKYVRANRDHCLDERWYRLISRGHKLAGAEYELVINATTYKQAYFQPYLERGLREVWIKTNDQLRQIEKRYKCIISFYSQQEWMEYFKI